MNATASKSSAASDTKPTPMYDHIKADYDIVIVGSGPAGLSAASRAREQGCKHVLLEAEKHASDTIYKYQKGKHVMAEPGILPLRSGMSFAAGRRETILGTWDKQLAEQGVNIQYGKRVNGITKGDYSEAFKITCEDGSEYTSKTVILGIGLQGNIRKMGVPGDSLERVQYTLNDPDEFNDESIIVIGAGDAGIENALGLAGHNKVYIVNRDEEFNRCKEGNFNLITAAEKDGSIIVKRRANSIRVDEVNVPGQPPMMYVMEGPNGEEQIPCHRIIARLGAIPPRKLVESFGVQFPSPDPTSTPALSEIYESNVPGLFIVGALGGYPLIKQAMNQGYEVVDTILGYQVEPADEPLLKDKFKKYGTGKTVNEILDTIQTNVPLFAPMGRLQLREFMLESTIHTPITGSIVFNKNDYTNSFYSIVEGSVEVEISDKDGQPATISLKQGQYFGEMGLISGRRRTATIRAGKNCVLIETPRRSMLKLIASVDDVRKQIDEAFVRRAISSYLAPSLSYDAVSELLAGGVEVRKFSAKQVLFKDGDAADGLYLIRRGSVTVSKIINGKEVVLSYVSAGNYVGEMALLSDNPRSATVTATVLTEALVLNGESVKAVLAKNPQWREALDSQIRKRVQKNVVREDYAGEDSDLIKFLINQGLGEATDALIIDESLCVQCNNCEVACAETHNGTSRLNRAAGPSFENVHIPTSCRHCEHPHCMKDCPPDAIRRNENGEVFIMDTCIGCGNCQRNCPYGVISMAVQKPPKAGGLISWLLFGLGAAPGKRQADYDPDAQKKAVKCDMCKGQKGGAACVRACPTGAAIRISPEKYMGVSQELLD